MIIFNCNICGSVARLMTGKEIYPHRKDLHNKKFYACNEHHDLAYIGCHPNTEKPLGKLLADAELRKLRKQCHNIFDVYWKKGNYTRTEAYLRLANILQIPKKKCHIGMFDKEQCIVMLNTLEFKDL